jgi:tRNA pseudouridine65 synthase
VSLLPPSVVSVLYQDAAVVVINKPAGIIVHRGWAQDEVTALSLVRNQIGHWVYPVHRLDRGTSGALVFATSPEFAARLGEAFAQERVHKRYLALVRGLAPEHVVVDHPLAKEPDKPKLPSITEVVRLSHYPVVNELTGNCREYSWVQAEPRTGRVHQVRRHLRHINHPIIGDVRYGKAEHNRLFRRRFGFDRLALHASSIIFPHPVHETPVEVQAPLATELQALLTTLQSSDSALVASFRG